jgi:interferon gamma-inducible protein 30
MGLLGMINLEFVPYGNGKMARVQKKSRRLPRISCQHGPDECKGNVIDNCFLKYAKDKKTGLRAVACFATKYYKTHWFKAMNFCSTKFGYNSTQIDKCANSREGQELQYRAGKLTHRLKVKGTPTYFLNGKQLPKQDEKLLSTDALKWVCKRYTGNLPKVCDSFIRKHK